MISPETIEQVRQATDVVELLGQYLKLKKRGRRYLALCPFHTEKTPSFSISPEKQLYYCFGCGRGGTVFTFLMDHEGMTFTEAVRFLASRANIPIHEDERHDARREEAEKVAFANQVALEYFRKQLASTRYRIVKDKYLIAKRGLTEESIEAFSLGLAGEDWDGLIKYAAPKGLTAADLVACGLALRSDKTGRYFDRFRHRLMIPIFNLSQKPIAFGGRTLKKGEPAKYVNSPETVLYIKGNVLYGLNTAKEDIKREKTAVVVEGYFDVISLWQVGLGNVVASSGTAFTLQQARLLSRFAEKVYLFFDADSAGRTAAMRSVDVLYDAGMDVQVVAAAPGEDPDSVARNEGIEGLRKLMSEALDYLAFRVQDVDLDATGIIGREKLVKELGMLGHRISDPTRRSLFWNEAAGLLRVDVGLLRGAASQEEAPAATPRVAAGKHDPIEANLLSLLSNNPGSIDAVFEAIAPEDFESRELARLYAAMAQQYRAHGVVNMGALIDNARDQEFISLATSISSSQWNREAVNGEMNSAVARFQERRNKRARGQLKEALARAEAAGDQEEINRILRELKEHGL